MSAIITYSFFSGQPYLLPNNVPADNNPDATILQSIIDKYEVEYLKTILGYSAYVSFINGLEDGDINDALNDGATYVDSDGITQKWEGFSVIGKSPIAAYIFFKYLELNSQTTTGVGQVQSVTENASRFTPIYRMVDAWNDMVAMNKHLHAYLYANRADFPDYVGLTYFGSEYANIEAIPPTMNDGARKFYNLFMPQNSFGI